MSDIVSIETLKKVVALSGAINLMGKYFPVEGRHDATLAWARVLYEGGLTEDKAAAIIYAAHHNSMRPKYDRAKIARNVADVYKAEAKGNTHLYGFKYLYEQAKYPMPVLEKSLELLGIERKKSHAGYTLTDV